MLATYRSLRLAAIGWAVVISVAAAVCRGRFCRAPRDYGPAHAFQCNVSYTDTLVLECPDLTSPFWKNGSDTIVICNTEGADPQYSNCTVNTDRNLTNQDSGLYFCKVQTSGSSIQLSYVQVDVLAPPSLLYVAFCDEDDNHICTYERIKAGLTEYFRVYVAWAGIGPFSVQWQHNGSAFACLEPHCRVERRSTNEMTLLFLANPHPDDVAGVYSANVSNNYGWNTSRTDVTLTICEPLAEPIIKSQNSSRNLADGSDVTLSCALSFNSDITLTVCYGKFDQNFNEFTNESINDQFCILCPGSSTGDYGPLPRTPGWEVQRKEEGECGNDLENIIVIGNFSEEDEGIIFCFYGDSEDPYQLYTTHTLTYAPGSSKSYTLYIVIGVVASVIILLIAILIIAMFTKQWIKRQKSPVSVSSPSIAINHGHNRYDNIPCAGPIDERRSLIPIPSGFEGYDGDLSSISSSSSYGQAHSDSPDDLGEDPNWRQPLLRELFLSVNTLLALYLYEIQSNASYILSGSVYVFDSHFNLLASGEDMTTSTHKQTSIPLIKSNDTVKYGSGGGMYINRIHDITIEIPERAIPEGTVLQLSISAMLYGPFLFPEGVRPVSPILWLCTDPTLTLSRSIAVVLPHYLHCEDQKDTENLMFLKAPHNPSTDGKIHFKPADGESVFKHHTNYGTLHTNHCCFLCIGARMTEKDTRNANLCLITAYPRNPQEHPWNVFFGVTYLLPTCMQAFRSHFTDDYQILHARKFRMQDTAERKIQISYPEHLPLQWLAGLNGSYKILASDVDFWSIWNRNPTELKTMEQEKMYPPNFNLIIDGRSAVGNTRLTASFSGIDCPLVVEVPLRLPGLPASTQHEMLNEPMASNTMDEQDDTIELRELCLELHTVGDWFNLGIYLHIPYSKLKIIEAEHNHNPLRCRTEMFQAWLDNFQPSWSAVIEALTLIGMSQLARRLASKKVSGFPPSHVPLHVQRNSPTPSQRYATNIPAQPHQSHQYQFQSTGHVRDVGDRSTLHISEAETLC